MKRSPQTDLAPPSPPDFCMCPVNIWLRCHTNNLAYIALGVDGVCCQTLHNDMQRSIVDVILLGDAAYPIHANITELGSAKWKVYVYCSLLPLTVARGSTTLNLRIGFTPWQSHMQFKHCVLHQVPPLTGGPELHAKSSP